MVFANAGITENEPFLQDALPIDGDGMPMEPAYPVLDVNLKAVLNIINLSWFIMKGQNEGGSIVLTASLAAYTHPAAQPLYGSLKAAVSLSFHLSTTHILQCLLHDHHSLSVSFDACILYHYPQTSLSMQSRPVWPLRH